MIWIDALLLLILDEIFMKSYRSIRFLTCIFVIFGRLTCKTPTSDFRDLFPVSKTHEKCASVRFLIRDPLREPIRPKFENFHLCNTFKNHWNFEKFQGCGSHLGVFRRALFKNQTLLTQFRHLSHACSRFTTNITQNVLYPIFSRTPTRNKQNSKNSWTKSKA